MASMKKTGPARKYRFFYGIRFKMTLGLLLVFLASGVFLYLMVRSQMTGRMEEQITGDMTLLWQNGNIYTRQLLIAGQLNNDEEGFSQVWEALLEELAGVTEYEAAVYDCQGNALSDTGKQTERSQWEEELFAAAAEGRAAYRMDYDQSEFCRVTFVMPVLVSGRQVGILRFSADYSEMQQENAQFTSLVIRVTALVFCVAFLLCFLVLGSIVSPALRLSKLSSRVTERLEEEDMENLPALRRSLMGRRDEIGGLAANYSHMLDTVRRQFRKIEGDKKQILELLQSRQEFFDNATHELKTPLTTIQGYAQLIQDDGGEDRELLDTGITHILKESARLHEMVIRLLEMSSHLPEQETEELDLTAMLRDVAASMEPRAGRYGNRFVVEGSGDCRILGWENQIRQLMVNLVDNAIKYGEENAPIYLETAEMEDSVILAVTNGGEGIPKEALERIFTPFYRVDKARSREMGSAGLGLYICEKIVEAHGGRITAESEPGRTVFRVEFPKGNAD